MLSRADRLLADFLLARRLVSRELLEQRARQKAAVSPRPSLAEILVQHGDVDAAELGELDREAREIDASLEPELPAGRTLGEFRLVREIGRGGMGIVYEAEQPSLGRSVALKILPAGAALDERLALRFLREARAAARLRHPGIVPIFASGRAEGVLYFAMELVDGPSLADRLSAGALPPGEAARIAAQLARALAHAHAEGLVHRDVKPENILLESNGRARITDFGLVLDSEAASTSLTQHALGTPAYMAPEQAEGRVVDARSDLYALGAVLYHMLAGVPPYEGDIPAAVLARVLTSDPPPLVARVPSVPPELAALCARAMHRDADLRPGTAEELALLLERCMAGLPSRASPSAQPADAGGASAGTGRRLTLAAGALGTLLAVAGLVWRQASPPAPAVPAPSAHPASLQAAGVMGGSVRRIAAIPGAIHGVGLSPDGTQVVYSQRSERGWALRVRDVDGPGSFLVADGLPAPGIDPSFSPDGRTLGFLRSGLKLVDSGGGEPWGLGSKVLAFSWSPSGDELAVIRYEDTRGRLWAQDRDGGGERLITSRDAGEPSWSPHGHRIAFVSRRASGVELVTIPAAGGEPVPVTSDPSAVWSPIWSRDGGFLYYGTARGGTPDVWRVALDEATGEVLGEPEPVTRGFLAAPFRLTRARDSSRIAITYRAPSEGVHEVIVDPVRAVLQGGTRALLSGTHLARTPRLSPDGTRLLCTESIEENLFLRAVVDPARDDRPRVGLTRGPFRDRSARWSPDGRFIAFDSDRAGRRAIWVMRSDGTEPRRIAGGDDRDAVGPVWSPDGRRLAYTVHGRGAYVVEVDEGASISAPAPLPRLEGAFAPSDWSGDGRILAGTSRGVVLLDLEENRYRRLTEEGEGPAWLGADWLVFWRAGALVRIDPRTAETAPIVTPGAYELLPAPAVRGDRLIFSLAVTGEDVWLLDPGLP